MNSYLVGHSYEKYFNFDFSNTNEEWQQAYLNFWHAVEKIFQEQLFTKVKPPERFYIPTLRSAVSIRDNTGKRINEDIFEQTVRHNYNLQDSELKIFTGNQLYETIRRDKNGTSKILQRLRKFERFLSNAFYEGRTVEIVALDESFEPGRHIEVRVQGEPDRHLHHLGDGINTLIILLYQLFMAESGSWVFIEEPELNLHPGLQRVFLQTLIENEELQNKKLRIFFTTHSNHLLRMTMRDGTIRSKDISIFAFQQRAEDKSRFLIRPLVSGPHEALNLLGVQNASVLLAQCGIWVEGVTDRQYLRAYLKAFQESNEFMAKELPAMREDTHYAFWEYAGSNLSHYFMGDIPRKGTPEAVKYEQGQKKILDNIESSALCNRIFLLADRDMKKEKKHRALSELAKGRNNFEYCVTQCVEIENLLSPTEIGKCLPDFLIGNSVTVDFPYYQTDYKDVRLGKFLSERFPESMCPNEWVAQSGTLKTHRKNRLCEIAVNHISWDTMSPGAKKLTKALYDFIAKHNNI